MIQFTILLAGKNIAVSSLFESSRTFCQDYLSDGTPELTIAVTWADIAAEREKSAREDALEGIPQRSFSDEYLETLAIYRKIVDKLVHHDTMLFHGSAIAVDGEGYLFTAKSGTGKSTHTRLWREHFGERAFMVNDDKPLLRITDSGVWVCGTPWDGKHRLSKNIMVPLRGICILERGAENCIARISMAQALPMLLQQSHRPSDMEKLLALIDKLGNSAALYRLKCNMDPGAAVVAYRGMSGKED